MFSTESEPDVPCQPFVRSAAEQPVSHPDEAAGADRCSLASDDLTRVCVCVFIRDAGRALAAGHADGAEEGAAGRRPQREDRPAAGTHGAGGEEDPGGGANR